MVNSGDFTKRLEKIMEFYSLSATAFSEAIDFNRSTISHLLSGRNKPSLEFVMKVVQKFSEVELYWLLNGKGTFPITGDKKEKDSLPKRSFADESKANANQSSKKPEIFQQQDQNTEQKEIDRIVVFYSDGTFKSYKD